MKAVYYHIENDFGTLVSRKKEKRTMKEVQVIVNNGIRQTYHLAAYRISVTRREQKNCILV